MNLAMVEIVSAVAVLVVLFVLLGLFVAVGWLLAVDHLEEQVLRLRVQRETLDAEWRSLENTARVRAVFMGARRAMHEESMRSERREADGH